METPLLPPAAPEAWAEQLTVSLRTERDRARELLAAQGSRLEQATALVEQQLLRIEEERKAERDETERLRAARDALETRLAQTEFHWAEVEKRIGESCDDEGRRAMADDLQRRYELALEDLRQARNKNSELQQQLAKARSTAAKLARQAQEPGSLDWEMEKQRILAALEAGGNEADEARRTERLGILEVLRTTDEVIAAKDREIRELRQRMEEQESRSEANASSTVSIEQAIDGDAAIQRERERLEKLQKECRDKLQKAEVEIAVERARIARHRADLEEQLRVAKNASPQPTGATAPDAQADRSAHGRWLARLGLTADDVQTGRHL